ncbi:MAG: hypothetical protein SGBAC_004989 [Bacillariaceae sp.]
MSAKYRSRKLSRDSSDTGLDEEEKQTRISHQTNVCGMMFESLLVTRSFLAIVAASLCAVGFLSRNGYLGLLQESRILREELPITLMTNSDSDALSGIRVGKAEGEQSSEEGLASEESHQVLPTHAKWDLSVGFSGVSDESQQQMISNVCSERKIVAPLRGKLSTSDDVTWTICMTINAGFYDFFQNWYIHYQKLDLNLDLVLFAEDSVAYERLSNAPFLNKNYATVVDATNSSTLMPEKLHSSTTATSSTVESESEEDEIFDAFTDRYNELISNRPTRLLQVLCSGRNVLYIDTDTALRKSPLPEINKHYLKGVDFSIAIEHSTTTDYAHGFEACTGFIAIKANSKTINFLSEWERKCRNEDEVAVNDQKAFNLAYEAMWSNRRERGIVLPRVEGLRSKLFPNGFQYFELYNEQQREKVVLAHANWIVGGDKKKQNFMEHGLWQLES